LLDERRNLLIAKTTLFDAQNLAKRVYTLPDLGLQGFGIKESAYALETQRGWVATRHYVYELEQYKVVSRTATAAADQMFFDRDGQLWFLNVAERSLRAQAIKSE
jgi:streptogramin lyase